MQKEGCFYFRGERERRKRRKEKFEKEKGGEKRGGGGGDGKGREGETSCRECVRGIERAAGERLRHPMLCGA